MFFHSYDVWVIFLKKYNSPENKKEDVCLNLKKILKNLQESLLMSDLNLDLADNNYLKCIGTPFH